MDWTLEFTCYTNWRGDWKRHKWNFNTYMWRFRRWKLVNGKKSTKKCTRESWNYLQTSALVSLWKENLSILESSQCNEGCQAWPRKNQTSMQKQNLQPQRPLQECKAERQQTWGSTTNVSLLWRLRWSFIKSRCCGYPRKEKSWICETEEWAGNDKFRWWIIFFE